MKKILSLNRLFFVTALLLLCIFINIKNAYAEESAQGSDLQDIGREYGGGYAATGQYEGVSYTSEIYDAANGLPTSDAMYILGDSDGHVWIGGYSGVICYDGISFVRVDPSTGITSARCIFEDSRHRIWFGTNDNGVVVMDGGKFARLTYEEGMPSSSIRAFVEDNEGNVYIGTTAGICYADSALKLHSVINDSLGEERVLRLDRDAAGRIYGQTLEGTVFTIENSSMTEIHKSGELIQEKITTILADPVNDGTVYLGTDAGKIYYGHFGDTAERMKVIPTPALGNIHWLNYDCERVWVSSIQAMGYLDKNYMFRAVSDIPVTKNIEMVTSDYQGNLWVASSSQGAMKLVTNNFVDISKKAGLPDEVTNAVCVSGDNIYIGTEYGLRLISKEGRRLENSLTEYVGNARVRCIKGDPEGNIWVGTFTENKGLICYSKDESIKDFTTQNGMPSDQIRSICFDHSGKVLAGTNGGLAVIDHGKVERYYGTKDGLSNTVIVTVEVLEDGSYMAGSDGGGLYIIKDREVKSLGRREGLTSDVIMRLVNDPDHDLCWVITSNSIQYLKDGKLNQIKSFPYNNNYDITFEDNGNAWVLSSYGVYVLKAEDMLRDRVEDYRVYTVENGIPFALTANAYFDRDEDGNLYMAGRGGVIRLKFTHFYEDEMRVKTAVRSVTCDNVKILPDQQGTYHLPSSKGRIVIAPSVMDYTLMNPKVRVFLEGLADDGVTALKNEISTLEYTDLGYGDYVLHIQILDNVTDRVISDDKYLFNKAPMFMELLIVRFLLLALFSVVIGSVVWWVMRSTTVRKQYDEVRKARDEAERANSAKTRFLANISHEIRTPINTIIGMNEMITREDPTGVPKNYFLSMMNYSFDVRNAAEALLSLINDLLDMSKIESGKMHLTEQSYDTGEMLRSIVSMIRGKSTEKELIFDVVVDELLPVKMYGDVAKIKQIVLNLLTNAVKYTEKGGFCLTVSMDEREGDAASLRFSVKDTGLGVKEEDMPKLFMAYERLDEEKNSSIQGTGLGLDISRRFAELMEGNLWCESTYGEGSEFILTVKQKIIDATPMGSFIERSEGSASGPYVPQFIAPDADILVVDDTPMNLNVIKGLLKATEVFVTTSESGEDAIGKIRDNHFDVVFLDHMMPGMDGIETLQEIRKINAEVPVYALTANASVGEDFYKEKGFNGYLSKPVDSELLEKTILKHIPEEMIKMVEKKQAVEELTELPENMQWLYETEGINVDEGIKNSGGINNYIFALNLFLDTIDGNAQVISDAYENDNIRLYTIKVHALKSSARIIGAHELSKHCEQLENAGNRNDLDFIHGNTGRLLTEYAGYKEKLSSLKEDNESREDKEEISKDELNEAYEALREMIPEMDYDAVESILEKLSEYKLPEEDSEKIKDVGRLLRAFDWDGLEKLFDE